MLLMPIGAIVFVDFWLMRRIGLEDRFAERTGIGFNWAAGAAWIGTVGACLAAINHWGGGTIFFISLPGWFLAAGLYIGLSAVLQRRWTAGSLTGGGAQS
jgi:hypothetical protein